MYISHSENNASILPFFQSPADSAMEGPIPIIIDPTSVVTSAFQSPTASAVQPKTGTSDIGDSAPGAQCEDFIMHGHVIHTNPEIHLFPIDEIYPWITSKTVILNSRGMPKQEATEAVEVELIDLTSTEGQGSSTEQLIHFENVWRSCDSHASKLVDMANKALETVSDREDWDSKRKLAMEMLRVGAHFGSLSQHLTESGTKYLQELEEHKKASSDKDVLMTGRKAAAVRDIRTPSAAPLPPPVAKLVRPRMWTCKVCTKSHASKREMESCCNVGTIRSYICSICQAPFYHKDDLNDHMDGHRSGPFICQVCGNIYQSSAQKESCVQGHVSRVERASKKKRDTWYTCDQCGKQYNRREAFKDHVDTHNPDRRYDCPICGKPFYNSNTKRQHVFKVHKKRID